MPLPPGGLWAAPRSKAFSWVIPANYRISGSGHGDPKSVLGGSGASPGTLFVAGVSGRAPLVGLRPYLAGSALTLGGGVRVGWGRWTPVGAGESAARRRAPGGVTVTPAHSQPPGLPTSPRKPSLGPQSRPDRQMTACPRRPQRAGGRGRSSIFHLLTVFFSPWQDGNDDRLAPYMPEVAPRALGLVRVTLRGRTCGRPSHCGWDGLPVCLCVCRWDWP